MRAGLSNSRAWFPWRCGCPGCPGVGEFGERGVDVVRLQMFVAVIRRGRGRGPGRGGPGGGAQGAQAVDCLAGPLEDQFATCLAPRGPAAAGEAVPLTGDVGIRLEESIEGLRDVGRALAR